MKTYLKSALLAMFAFAFFGAAFAQTQYAASNPSKKTEVAAGDLVAWLAGNSDYSTLVAAVKAAGLVETLQGAGPFTVFAPNNAAFEALPAGTVESLLKPENKATLAKILTYHVVNGKLTAADVLAAIKAGNGKAVLTTVSGGKLTAQLEGGNVVLVDENGGKSTVTKTDIMASNGVAHAISAVVLPK
jgi:uncharacterized surface protein with fasciclin (FAS1) repeats